MIDRGARVARNQERSLTAFLAKKAEFDALPAWRRALERFYRSPLGLGPYYLKERWWRDKLFPRRSHAVGVRPAFRAHVDTRVP